MVVLPVLVWLWRLRHGLSAIPTACRYLPRPAAARIKSEISCGWETKER
jgi:hypothetical protein